MGTVEKLTLENMGVTFGILSLGGTETEIHLGGHLPLPPNCNVRFKKYHCNTRVKGRYHGNLLVAESVKLAYHTFIQLHWHSVTDWSIATPIKASIAAMILLHTVEIWQAFVE